MIKTIYKNSKEVSDLMKILSSSNRLEILAYIDNGSKPVSAITKKMKLSQSQISQYLSQMKSKGILKSKRD